MILLSFHESGSVAPVSKDSFYLTSKIDTLTYFDIKDC